MRHTPATLANFIAAQAPNECCIRWEICCEGISDWLNTKPSDLPACKAKPALKAAPLPLLVRLGKDAERTADNPTGGGPKTWFPGRNAWFTLASLEQDLAAAQLPAGLYRVIYADGDENQINREALVLPVEWSDGEQAGTTQTEPGPRQSHFDAVHRVMLDREKIHNSAEEGHAKAAREALAAGALAITESQKTIQQSLDAARELVSAAHHQVVAAGILAQASRESAKEIALNALSVQQQKPMLIELIGALKEAGDVLIPKIADAVTRRTLANRVEIADKKEPARLLLVSGPGDGEQRIDADLDFAVKVKREQ